MGRFTGKTLLMLGSNPGAAEMVAYARRGGAYTIAADYLPITRSNAKQVCDEAVEISTQDLDGLSAFLRTHPADAVLSGVSERNLLAAMELSRRHGLPFYCNRSQWEEIEDKERFRALCIACGVPSPRVYAAGAALGEWELRHIVYPAVVKPVDASASRGVHLCGDEAQLKKALPDALAQSGKGRVLVEEYIAGEEFTAHYAVCGGEVALCCMDERHSVSVHSGAVTTIPAVRVYPSIYLEAFEKAVNPALLRLGKRLGLKNGMFFVQGIRRRTDGAFFIFEGGLRSAGELPSRLTGRTSGINGLHQLVDCALLGHSEQAASACDPAFGGKCCAVASFAARHGVVARICGVEEALRRLPGGTVWESRYFAGDEIPDTDTLRQLVLRFWLVCEDRSALSHEVHLLNRMVAVLDENGNDLLIRPDPEAFLTFGAKEGGQCECL